MTAFSSSKITALVSLLSTAMASSSPSFSNSASDLSLFLKRSYLWWNKRDFIILTFQGTSRYSSLNLPFAGDGWIFVFIFLGDDLIWIFFTQILVTISPCFVSSTRCISCIGLSINRWFCCNIQKKWILCCSNANVSTVGFLPSFFGVFSPRSRRWINSAACFNDWFSLKRRYARKWLRVLQCFCSAASGSSKCGK